MAPTQIKHDGSEIKGRAVPLVGGRQYLVLLTLVPLLAVCIFSWAAFRSGSPGFRVDKTQHGLYISEVFNHKNPVKNGDLIVAVNGRPYTQVLGLLLIHTGGRQSSRASITVRRGGETFTFQPLFTPLTWPGYFAVAWPHLLLIALFLVLAVIALYWADSRQPAGIFCFMLCWFATTIATTLPSHFGLLQPRIISLSFLGITISNWLAFGALAHFICRFPRERDLCRARPLCAVLFYLAPALIAVVGALIAAGVRADFFGALQRFRNLCLPVIIVGAFVKHVIDLRNLHSPLALNQVKLSLAAYGLTFTPYLTLYLLPNLLFDQPLISFRIVLMAAMILPLAYFIALLRYRLLGVGTFISRAIAYFFVIVGLVVIYAFLLTCLKQYFWGHELFSEEMFLVFLLIVALGLSPLVNRLQRLIEHYFFRYRLDDQLLFDLSNKLVSTLKLSELITLITGDLPRLLRISGSAVLLFDGNYSLLYPEDLRIGSAPWPQSHLVRNFQQGEAVFFCRAEYNDPELNGELSQLNDAGYALALPLGSRSQLTGLLLLGDREDGGLFRENDILLLSTFANQAAVALNNSLHYRSLLKSKKQLEAMFNRVVQSEKMAALGEISATLAHEIKNPLGIIRSSAQYLADKVRNVEVNREILQYIIDEVDGLNEVISSVLGLAKFKNPHLKPIDLRQYTAKICRRWESGNDHNPSISLDYRVAERLPLLYADPQQIRQVLLNLLRNSEEAIKDAGNIVLTVEKEDEFVVLCIQDDGPGIYHEQAAELFENFFTTKKDGLGLGLNVCEQIISAHHGSITIRNRARGGAEAVIRLPFHPLTLASEENKDTGIIDGCQDIDT